MDSQLFPCQSVDVVLHLIGWGLILGRASPALLLQCVTTLSLQVTCSSYEINNSDHAFGCHVMHCYAAYAHRCISHFGCEGLQVKTWVCTVHRLQPISCLGNTSYISVAKETFEHEQWTSFVCDRSKEACRNNLFGLFLGVFTWSL